jgi:hypothetical protein
MKHQDDAPPVDPSNPYNIDFAKEKRTKRMFIILIASGFVLAAILLVLGFLLDSIANPVPEPRPAIQQPESEQPLNSSASSRTTPYKV